MDRRNEKGSQENEGHRRRRVWRVLVDEMLKWEEHVGEDEGYK